MERDLLLKIVGEKTGLKPEIVEQVYYAVANTISESLGNGENVELKPELGIFLTKYWDNPGRGENSPRTAVLDRYKVRFRPSNELEKKLIIKS